MASLERTRGGGVHLLDTDKKFGITLDYKTVAARSGSKLWLCLDRSVLVCDIH